MNIRTSTWHARVYDWFRRDCGHEGSLYMANLCPYMRTVLFWAPMRWLLLRGRIGPVRIPLVFWPSLGVALPAIFNTLFGWDTGRGLLAIYLLIGAGFAGAGFLIGIFTLLKLASKKLGHVQALDSFAEVSKAYVQGVHSKICPIIRFTDKPKE